MKFEIGNDDNNLTLNMMYLYYVIMIGSNTRQ